MLYTTGGRAAGAVSCTALIPGQSRAKSNCHAAGRPSGMRSREGLYPTPHPHLPTRSLSPQGSEGGRGGGLTECKICSSACGATRQVGWTPWPKRTRLGTMGRREGVGGAIKAERVLPGGRTCSPLGEGAQRVVSRAPAAGSTPSWAAGRCPGDEVEAVEAVPRHPLHEPCELQPSLREGRGVSGSAGWPDAAGAGVCRGWGCGIGRSRILWAGPHLCGAVGRASQAPGLPVGRLERKNAAWGPDSWGGVRGIASMRAAGDFRPPRPPSYPTPTLVVTAPRPGRLLIERESVNPLTLTAKLGFEPAPS